MQREVEQMLNSPRSQLSQSSVVDAMDHRAWRWCSSMNNSGPRDLLLGPCSDHYDGYEKKHDHHQHPCSRRKSKRVRLNTMTQNLRHHHYLILMITNLNWYSLPSEMWDVRGRDYEIYGTYDECHGCGSTDSPLTNIAETPNVKQPSGLKVIWDRLMEGDTGGKHLEELRSLRRSFQSPPSDTSPTTVDTLTAYGQLSLDDSMQFTCIQQPQKLYYSRLHTVMGMCFWFSLERIIIVLWRKMCKSSLTLHQRGFTPGTENYYSFTTGAAHEKNKKKKISAVKSTAGEAFPITYHLHPLNIDLESLRIDLSFGKKKEKFFTECKLLSKNLEKTKCRRLPEMDDFIKGTASTVGEVTRTRTFSFLVHYHQYCICFSSIWSWLVGLQKDRCHLQRNDVVK